MKKTAWPMGPALSQSLKAFDSAKHQAEEDRQNAQIRRLARTMRFANLRNTNRIAWKGN